MVTIRGRRGGERRGLRGGEGRGGRGGGGAVSRMGCDVGGAFPAFGAGERILGTGWEKSLKAEKPSSCHDPFGLDAAG